jgi:hypothetical protein
MQALSFWKAVVADKADFLDEFVSLLSERRIGYCVVGGQGVNASSLWSALISTS